MAWAGVVAAPLPRGNRVTYSWQISLCSVGPVRQAQKGPREAKMGWAGLGAARLCGVAAARVHDPRKPWAVTTHRKTCDLNWNASASPTRMTSWSIMSSDVARRTVDMIFWNGWVYLG